MTVLLEKDYQEMLSLIYLANECRDMEHFINGFLPAVSRVFRSEITTFHLLKGDSMNPVISESRGFITDGLNTGEDKYNPGRYRDYYYQQSPLLKEAMSSTRQAFKIAAVMSPRDWEMNEFFHDFILPQQLYWELFLALRWENRLAGMVTLWRPKKQDDFQDEDLLKGQLLTPHLMQVVHHLCQGSGVRGLNGEMLPCDIDTIRNMFMEEFHLSEREIEILHGIISGMSYDEMAASFCISRFTVHTHVKNIYTKIGIHNRIDLGRYMQNISRQVA